jgi:hypothetical protein
MRGGLIGASDGDMIGQIVGGQIGSISNVLSHRGFISPSTHWHVQPAYAEIVPNMHNAADAKSTISLIVVSSF